ncbi:MAG: hypothetical protein WC134_02855 [Acholeplasmataceae bacterium]|jgi:hypothetical protein|nr:hypothetical protein [Acholeplasmataceae bacterium]MDD4194167.1 hypothetical protein [Acholeplasmataceae bacterium]
MEISWFNEKPKDCIVTVSTGNITLNKMATTYFENAYSVMLGIEKDKKMIVIKPMLKAEAQSHAIPDNKKYRITVRSSYSRVTNKAFVEEISDLFQIDLSTNPKKFVANWHSKEQILTVDLKEEL